MLHFIQEFGLILFQRPIGIQVGPGFQAAARLWPGGLTCSPFLIVIPGGLLTAVLHKLFDTFSPWCHDSFRVVTNTPARAGAGQGSRSVRSLACCCRIPSIDG